MRVWITAAVAGCIAIAIALLPEGGVRSVMGAAASVDTLTIRGELTDTLPGALPPEAIAVIEARRGAGNDAPVLAELRLPLGGRQAPVPFTLEIARERIDALGALYVRGGIAVRGRMEWVSAPVRIEPRDSHRDLGALRMAQAGTAPRITRVQASAAEIAMLTGEAWTVTAIGDDELPAADRPVTLRFGTDGSVSGQGPCNGFRGAYRVAEGRLVLSQIASTLMACPAPLMTRERTFFDTLREIGDFETPGEGLLVLRTPDGRTLEAKR